MIGIQLCCLSENCFRVLTNQDNLNNHISHKIVTSQSIIEAFKVSYSIIIELRVGVNTRISRWSIFGFLEQQSHKQLNFKQFIKTLTTEILDFQQNIIQQTKLLIDHLNSVNVGQLVDQEIIQNYQNILNKQLDCNNVNQLIKIVQPQHSFNEKQLKDGNNDIQGMGTCLSINLQHKINIMRPKKYYNDVQEKCQMQEQRIKFIQSKLEELNVNFTYKLTQWTKTVESLFSFQQLSQFTLMPQTKSKNIKSSALAKIELHHICKDTLIYAQQNQIHLFGIDNLKMCHSVKFNQPVVDYTVDPEKLLIAIMIGIDLIIFNLISFKQIRHFKITIDTSKGVALKFFENQICVSSGVSLQFFPVFPSSLMPQFNQALIFIPIGIKLRCQSIVLQINLEFKKCFLFWEQQMDQYHYLVQISKNYFLNNFIKVQLINLDIDLIFILLIQFYFDFNNMNSIIINHINNQKNMVKYCYQLVMIQGLIYIKLKIHFLNAFK